ncbi:stalk domain-containing protein [Paenibacillus sp. YN15]|uniref:stalk domain-containing protein n=1 Tax=Paenibacillus sp. YN15 TaxID=1742774 RepID=UPI000DCD6F86|nr:hypothetical protein [Paenibacillus sp. YN15]RAU96849.1 hypothetical protein DQG13_20055 [Paenibacillus sp. YN15]
MKKAKNARTAVVAFILGAALATATGALADGVSLIGKSFDGQFSVTINGKKIDAAAGVSEGTSYLPVRAVGEALGLAVDFDSKEGIFLTESTTEPVSTPQPSVSLATPTPSSSTKTPNYTPAMLKQREIVDVKADIRDVSGVISGYESFLSRVKESANPDPFTISNMESAIATHKTKLAELERQLSELEAEYQALISGK